MKPTLLLVQGVVLASATRLTKMPASATMIPRAEVTIAPAEPETEFSFDFSGVELDQDHWECATENMTQYFDVPKPTGTLFDALVSYGQVLTSRICSLSGPESLRCPPVEKAAWCGFTTWAPSTLIPDFSSHASKASSWLASHSSGVAILPTDCPNTWNYAKMRLLDGEGWLNGTIAWAECYEREGLKNLVVARSKLGQGDHVG